MKPNPMELKTLTPLTLVLLSIALASDPTSADPLKAAEPSLPPPGFVDLSSSHPDIQVEMRYASKWNFMGHVVPGYRTNKCYLTDKAAWALHRVQARVAKKDTLFYSSTAIARPRQSGRLWIGHALEPT